MMISTQSYDDFHTVVQALPSPIVFSNATGGWWYAWSVAGGVAVTFNQENEPANFATDFPAAIALSSPISIA